MLADEIGYGLQDLLSLGLSLPTMIAPKTVCSNGGV